MTNHERVTRYFERIAPMIAANPAEYYARVQAGMRFQAQLWTPKRKANVLRLKLAGPMTRGK